MLNKQISPVVFATMFQGMALGIIIPSMTYLVKQNGISNENVPLIFSVFSFFAFLSAVFWGKMSDKYGQKRVLIITSLATTASYIWLAIATILGDIVQIFMARAFAGIFAGWMAAAFSYVGIATSIEDRTKSIGFLAALFSMGFVVGPITGGYISKNYGFEHSYFLSAILCFISFLITIAFTKKIIPSTTSLKAKLFDLFKDKAINKVLFVVLITFIVFTAVETSMGIYFLNTHQIDAKELGIIITIGGLGQVFSQGYFVRVLSKKMSDIKIIVLNLKIFALGIVLLSYSELFGLYLPVIIFSIGIGTLIPTFQSLVSKLTPENKKGLVAGVVQSIQNYSRIVGPILITLISYKIHLYDAYLILSGVVGLLLLWIFSNINKFVYKD